MTNTSKKFGEEIKRLRLEKNLGVREFAKMIIKDDGEPISPSYKDAKTKDRYFTLVHELYEMQLIRDGYSYWDAHKKSLKMESRI